MTRGSWEKTIGKAYRKEHKKEHYDAVTIQIRKDGSEGFTRSDLNKYAEARGLTAGGCVKKLIRAALAEDQQLKNVRSSGQSGLN